MSLFLSCTKGIFKSHTINVLSALIQGIRTPSHGSVQPPTAMDTHLPAAAPLPQRFPSYLILSFDIILATFGIGLIISSLRLLKNLGVSSSLKDHTHLTPPTLPGNLETFQALYLILSLFAIQALTLHDGPRLPAQPGTLSWLGPPSPADSSRPTDF